MVFEMSGRSLRDLQDMLRKLYFHHDSKRGVERTYSWLLTEVWELGKAVERGSEEEMRGEFADVLAWLLSLANLVGIDVEEAVVSKYWGRCPKCQSLPCKCEFREGPGKSVEISLKKG